MDAAVNLVARAVARAISQANPEMIARAEVNNPGVVADLRVEVEAAIGNAGRRLQLSGGESVRLALVIRTLGLETLEDFISLGRVKFKTAQQSKDTV